jgi:chemotaxis protein methyltransferase CheR
MEGIDLTPFKQLIHQRCGLQFTQNRDEERLRQAISQRLRQLTLPFEGYYSRLLQQNDEFQALITLLTINETYFFREPDQLDLLVNQIIPRLLAQLNPPRRLRLLSAGCSSGEEPYSIVMALMQRYGRRIESMFEIYGGDIDEEILARARLGIYSPFSFRGVAESIRQSYFTLTDRGYQISDEVRRLVTFSALNLLDATIAPPLVDFDIILLRNVSIYFDRPTRITIQRNLAARMCSNAFLIIGSAETLANDLGVLPLQREAGQFYFVKGHPPLANTPGESGIDLPTLSPEPTAAPAPPSWTEIRLAEPATAVADEPAPPAAIAPPEAASRQHLRDLCRHHSYDEALPLCERLLLDAPEDEELLILKGYLLLNRKAFTATIAIANNLVARNTWAIDALLLLGQAHRWLGENEAAIRWFKQAIYSQHECWPAHYYLAELWRQQGDLQNARRALRLVIQQVAQGESRSGVRYLPLDLNPAEVRFLSETKLQRLEATPPSTGQRRV